MERLLLGKSIVKLLNNWSKVSVTLLLRGCLLPLSLIRGGAESIHFFMLEKTTEKGGYRQENAVFYLKKENGCKK